MGVWEMSSAAPSRAVFPGLACCGQGGGRLNPVVASDAFPALVM